MHDVIREIFDDGDFMEVHKHFATNLLAGFARLNGHPVGVVAKSARPDGRHIGHRQFSQRRPLRTFLRRVQHPADHLCRRSRFPAGIDQEWGGIITHGAKLLYAFCEATVPKLTVITRKAYGGAYDVMNSKHIRADFNFAWPTAEIAVLGPQGAANILYGKELAAIEDPDEKARRRQELVANPIHCGRARLRV